MNFTFTPSTEAQCRCGGKVTLGRALDLLMDDGSPTPVTIHSDPPCKDFVKLDPVSYLRWLRGATEN